MNTRKHWSEIIESNPPEKEKRRDLLAVAAWALGIEDKRTRLQNPILIRKLFTEWLLWKWATPRGLEENTPTKEQPRWEFWSEAALQRKGSRSTVEKECRHEHAVPRSVIAKELAVVSEAGDLSRILGTFAVEVVMLKEEADSIDGEYRETCPEGLPAWNDATSLWCRYEAWAKSPAGVDFQKSHEALTVWLVPWWKSGNRWKNGWKSAMCHKVFPTE